MLIKHLDNNFALLRIVGVVMMLLLLLARFGSVGLSIFIVREETPNPTIMKECRNVIFSVIV